MSEKEYTSRQTQHQICSLIPQLYSSTSLCQCIHLSDSVIVWGALVDNFNWVQTRVISRSGLKRKDHFCFNFRLLSVLLKQDYNRMLSGTPEDKVVWTFKGSNLDWPCPVNGWPAAAANEAVCRRRSLEWPVHLL